MQKIKTGDNVKVMRGKDSGKTGEVLAIVKPKPSKKPMSLKVVVKGINIVKKHQKPNPTMGIAGGLIEIEKPISISNVMLVDGDKASRIKIIEKDGKNVRAFVKSGKEV